MHVCTYMYVMCIFYNIRFNVYIMNLTFYCRTDPTEEKVEKECVKVHVIFCYCTMLEHIYTKKVTEVDLLYSVFSMKERRRSFNLFLT